MIRGLYRFSQKEYTKWQAGRNGQQGGNPEWETELTTPQASSTTLDGRTPNSAAPTPRPSFPIKRFIILAVSLFIPIFLETLDYTVVATAQTEIASAFNQLSLQSYISTSYLLTSTVFLPFFASVAHVYGRHNALQISLVIFMIGSALATGAQNLQMVLAGRGISGVGAAGLLAVVRIILADASTLDENNWQSTLLTALYFPGYVIGPYIGGALVSVSFRWVFGINLPAAAAAMILAFLLLRKITPGPQLPRGFQEGGSSAKPSQIDRLLQIDWVGTAVFVAGGILLLLGLNWGSQNDWKDVKTIVSLIVGVLLIAACLAWEYVLERKQTWMDAYPGIKQPTGVWKADPMIPLSLFRSYDVSATEFAALTSGMIMLVVFYFVAIFATIVSGKSSSQAGVQLLYFAPGLGVGAAIATRLIKTLRQPKYPIILGTLIIPISLGLLSLATQKNDENQVNGFLVMAGVGVGMTFGPLSVHARFSQTPDRAPVVVALNLFFRSLGGTIGLAQCFTILNVKVNSYLVSHASSIPDGSILGTLSVTSLTSVQGINDLPADVQAVVRAAFGNAVRWCFLSLVPWCSLAFVACLFLSNIEDRPAAPVPSTSDSEAKLTRDPEANTY